MHLVNICKTEVRTTLPISALGYTEPYLWQKQQYCTLHRALIFANKYVCVTDVPPLMAVHRVRHAREGLGSKKM